MGTVPEKAGISTATRTGGDTDLPAQPKMAQNLQRRWFWGERGVISLMRIRECRDHPLQSARRMEMVLGEDGGARPGDREGAHGQQGQRGCQGGVRWIDDVAWWGWFRWRGPKLPTPPEMLTHPPHLVGVNKLLFPAVCEVELELDLMHSVCLVSSLHFGFFLPRSGEDGPRRRDIGGLDNVRETLKWLFLSPCQVLVGSRVKSLLTMNHVGIWVLLGFLTAGRTSCMLVLDFKENQASIRVVLDCAWLHNGLSSSVVWIVTTTLFKMDSRKMSFKYWNYLVHSTLFF